MRASARELFPALANARAVESRAGLVDVMPDEIPVIGERPAVDPSALSPERFGGRAASGARAA